MQSLSTPQSARQSLAGIRIDPPSALFSWAFFVLILSFMKRIVKVVIDRFRTKEVILSFPDRKVFNDHFRIILG
jgi:hypothetical protein